MSLQGAHTRPVSWACVALLVAFSLQLAAVGVVNSAARPYTPHRVLARAAAACRVPRLTGLTLSVARKRAKAAGCRTRLAGARATQAAIQTIARQSTHTVGHVRVITLLVNPLCSGTVQWGPPGGEPLLTAGPTQLVSGLYLRGGPPVLRSAPRCSSLSGTPAAGTITVTQPGTATPVATQAVARGQLATIPLPPGKYTITGIFANALPPPLFKQPAPLTVTIPAGRTVRQDLTVAVPLIPIGIPLGSLTP
jgi:hypothetical protein